ncbi:MAG: hypothetical protein P8X74_15935 [Reinekea sp.]
MACALCRYGVTDSGKTCIKKVPPDVHRKGNGPSLVKSWNKAVDFWRASRRVGRRLPNNTYVTILNRRVILICVLFETLH